MSAVCALIRTAFEWTAAVMRRRRGRRDLARLDDHLLRDIGLTRNDARREIEKLF